MADQKPDAVPFAHGAAGHQGLTSNTSGTILTKPCTQAEISFYESASTDPAHAAFYAHMPTFLGSLHPAADQPGLSKLLHGSDGVGAPPAPATAPAEPSDGKQDGAASKEETSASSAEKKGEGWTPSGGKKLATGLAICLANTASGCARPCVLDLKLGERLWDDEAPLAKRQKLDEVAASSTSGSLGFRVAGMRVWVGGRESGEGKLAEEEQRSVTLEDGYKSYDKFYGRQFKGRQDVRKAFEAFLPPAKPAAAAGYRKEIGARFVRELESVVYMLEHEESRMYSASLLFVYEGDEAQAARALEFEKDSEKRKVDGGDEDEDDEVEVEVGEGGVGTDENDEEIEPKVHDLRLIDFAHARWAPGEGRDENALRGVRSALEVLRDVLGE